jgi:four helix bundle protein
MQTFERLLVWRNAHAVAVELFHLTAPWREWELRSQMRRSAASIPANIAEGAGSDSERLFARYLLHAQASASKLRYHLRYAKDVGLLDAERHEALDQSVQEVRRMLTGLTRRLRAAQPRRGQ